MNSLGRIARLGATDPELIDLLRLAVGDRRQARLQVSAIVAALEALDEAMAMAVQPDIAAVDEGWV